MPAITIENGWSAHCKDCNWESTVASSPISADIYAEHHNKKHHPEVIEEEE